MKADDFEITGWEITMPVWDMEEPVVWEMVMPVWEEPVADWIV